MKRIIIPVFCLLSILLILLKIDDITDRIIVMLNPVDRKTNIIKTEYSKDNFAFVSNTDNFTPYGKQDILNIFYTILNTGKTNEIFYCPKEYKNCIEDIKEISKDDNLLTHLNNFVHPYYSFASMNTDITDTGEIHLTINYIYTEEEKKSINDEVDKLIKELITEDIEEDYDKIKIIHDYIINKTKYDLQNNKELKSFNAYGTLFNHLATCNGYTDLMAIFLTKLGYENFKIATTNEKSGHVWNAVKVNNEWLHLDLTWDDPVSSDNKDYLYHKYFLIDTEELITADSNITSKEHNFKQTIYSELKPISKN